ncbi:SDR family oxidoreductase [Streptomyces xanthochromogenes]|uniref:SDR family oxidoreductase n=1 Tax=Streptomyces xanthochromogenes TaxID=67384 RepID=UPI00380F1812
MSAGTMVVSGAGRGLGRAVAEHFAEEGWQVIAGARAPDRVPGHEGVIPVKLDVRDADAIAGVAAVVGTGSVDVLVSVAGVFDGVGAGLDDVRPEAMTRAFAVNALGPLELARALLPALRRGRTRTIVMVSGLMGSIGLNEDGGNYAYRASKAALNAISRSLALDLAADGIGVICLHPGWLDTEMGRGWSDPHGDHEMVAVSEVAQDIQNLLEDPRTDRGGRLIDHRGAVLPW